jgi:hypothetical protein
MEHKWMLPRNLVFHHENQDYGNLHPFERSQKHHFFVLFAFFPFRSSSFFSSRIPDHKETNQPDEKETNAKKNVFRNAKTTNLMIFPPQQIKIIKIRLIRLNCNQIHMFFFFFFFFFSFTCRRGSILPSMLTNLSSKCTLSGSSGGAAFLHQQMTHFCENRNKKKKKNKQKSYFCGGGFKLEIAFARQFGAGIQFFRQHKLLCNNKATSTQTHKNDKKTDHKNNNKSQNSNKSQNDKIATFGVFGIGLGKELLIFHARVERNRLHSHFAIQLLRNRQQQTQRNNSTAPETR